MTPAFGIDLCQVVVIDQDSGLITLNASDEADRIPAAATYTLQIKGSIVGYPENSATQMFSVSFEAVDESLCPASLSETTLG